MNSSTLFAAFLAALVLMLGAMGAMAVGRLFGRRCLRGSCGGAGGSADDSDDDRIACDDCPNRRRAKA